MITTILIGLTPVILVIGVVAFISAIQDAMSSVWLDDIAEGLELEPEDIGL